jgi:hypothetical protein
MVAPRVSVNSAVEAIDETLCGANFPHMKAAIFALTAVVALSGCAIHSKEEMAAVRSAGVSPRTVARLDSHAPISPEDVIELRRHRVSDAVPLRHLDRVGVDYVVTKDDIKAMRAARVSQDVTEAVTDASRRFVSDRYAPRRNWYWDVGYLDPYPYYYWPSVSYGYGGGYGYGYGRGYYNSGYKWRGGGHHHHGGGHRHRR